MGIVNVERSVSYTLTADDGKERTYTLSQGAKSFGIMRHWQPVLRRYRIAFIIFLRECFRFLSCVLMIFSITCYCLSVRLVEYCIVTLIDWYS